MSDDLTRDMPKRIWLQPHMYPEITWCQDKIDETDVEYVRADLLDEKRAKDRKEGE